MSIDRAVLMFAGAAFLVSLALDTMSRLIGSS